MARRIDPSVGVFIAAADRSAAALEAMGALVGPGERVGIVETEAWPLPDGLHAVTSASLTQMVADAVVPGPTPPDPIVTLTAADASAMLDLATLTRPGPFLAGTHRLGGFVGIRRDGRLIAMAGTRLALPGHVEVSGVCTHPHHRGGGLAAALIRTVATAILAGGDRPFLTNYSDNASAIGLYETIGFRTRAKMTFTMIERPADLSCLTYA